MPKMSMGMSSGTEATSGGAAVAVSAAGSANTHSIVFDGVNDYIGFTLAHDFSSGGFSASCWVKVDEIPTTGGASEAIITKSTGVASTLMLDIYGSGNVRVQTRHTTGGHINAETNVGELIEGVWYHIVVTMSSSDVLNIYVDGTTCRPPKTSMPRTNVGNWRIGESYVSGWGSIDGKVDGVAIWNVELSAANVLTLYNSGTPVDSSAQGISGLLSYFKLDNDNTDNEGYASSIATGGSPTFSTDTASPYFNTRSLVMDGTGDYVNCGNDSSLRITGDMTVSAWIHFDATGEAEQVISRYNWSTTKRIFYFGCNSGKPSLTVSDDGTKIWTQTADSALSTGVWHHIVAVFDAGTDIIIYADGSAVASTLTTAGGAAGGVPAAMYDTDPDLLIGAQNTPSISGEHDGFLDECAIWNAELDLDDITAIWNSGHPNDLTLAASYNTDRTPNLKGYWRFEEPIAFDAEDESVTDHSGEGNTGTIKGGATWANSRPGTTTL